MSYRPPRGNEAQIERRRHIFYVEVVSVDALTREEAWSKLIELGPPLDLIQLRGITAVVRRDKSAEWYEVGVSEEP